jgi:hypothetical protein
MRIRVPDDEPKLRPRPKESRRVTRWSPKLLEDVKAAILVMIEDWVVKETVVASLGALPHEVGHALNKLCLDGILYGPVQHPHTYTYVTDSGTKREKKIELPNRVMVGKNYVLWDEDRDAWLYHAFPGYSRRKLSQRELAKILKKNPPKSVWDGLAYRIMRDSRAFMQLQVEHATSPRGGGLCTRCGQPQGFHGKNARHKRGHDKSTCDHFLVVGVMET